MSWALETASSSTDLLPLRREVIAAVSIASSLRMMMWKIRPAAPRGWLERAEVELGDQAGGGVGIVSINLLHTRANRDLLLWDNLVGALSLARAS